MDRAASKPERRVFDVEDVYADGNPYPHYAWFRVHDPVHVGDVEGPFGLPSPFVFRHADVMGWLKDPRMVRQRSSVPELSEERDQGVRQPPERDSWSYVASRFMLFLDPPDHTRLRGLANRAFTPRVIADRRGEIEEIAAGLLAAFRDEQGGEGDLIAALAFPLPVLVIARVLGIPREDLHRLREWAAVLGAAIDVPMEALAALQARIDECSRDMSDYLRAVVAKRRDDPRDDLISRLIAARDDEGKITDDELIATCILLMIAGHETTVNLIANGTLALMRHRDQWDRLVADPSLAGNAAEELLRYDSPVQLTARIAAEDVEIGNVRMPRGTHIHFMLGSANRDETVWDEPDSVQIDRKVGRHMSFGMGIHFCLGAPLARLEGEVAFATLAREAPDLALANPNPAWRAGAVLHGLQRLDVRLGG